MDTDKKPNKLKAALFSAGRITKKGVRAAVIVGAMLAPTCGIANIWGKWVYQVKTNYGVVITDWNGQRKAVDKPGWHSRMPLFSTYEEEYPLANQAIFLHGMTVPHEIITREKSSNEGFVIMAAAATFYGIDNLRQYAIENVKMDIVEVEKAADRSMMGQNVRPFVLTPRIMLQRTLDSIVGDHIQKRDPKDLIHNRGEVEKEILESILKSDVQKLYGIKITGFNFTETNYIPDVVRANASKQATITEADGKYAASQMEKKTIETLASAEAEKYKILAQAEAKKYKILAEAEAERYKILEKALNPKTPAEKRLAQEIFQSIIRYSTLKERPGDNVWVIPDQQSPMPVYNPGASKK